MSSKHMSSEHMSSEHMSSEHVGSNQMSTRRCVITGAASGIGAALAELFVLNGYEIIGIDRDEDGALELYNLANDIGEEQNLAKREAKRTVEMHSMMKAWRRATNAPVPKEKNPKFDPAAYKAAFNRR